MSWIHGTADSYLDFSDKMVAAATGSSVQSIDGIVDGGNGYIVGEFITLTGGTFSLAAQLEVLTVSAGAVTSARIHNSGAYTVDPTDPVAQGSTDGSGIGATFNLTLSSNGWTSQRDTTWSGSEKEVILKGNGGGLDEIFIGWRTFSGSGYYNFELHGMTGFNSGLEMDEQPGVSPGFHDEFLAVDIAGAYMLCHNATLYYWLNINSSRIIIVTKVGSAYFNAYLGFGNRFGTISEIPYPMCIAGHTSTPFDLSNQSKLSSGLIDPWSSSTHPAGGPMWVLGVDNTWYQITNGEMSLGSRAVKQDRVVIPAQVPLGTTSGSTAPEDKFMSNMMDFSEIIQSSAISGVATANVEPSPGTTEAHVLLPPVIVMSTPVIQVLMELDDVFWISSFGAMNTEDRVIISGEVYRIFQNCNRTDSYAFLAIKEA